MSGLSSPRMGDGGEDEDHTMVAEIASTMKSETSLFRSASLVNSVVNPCRAEPRRYKTAFIRLRLKLPEVCPRHLSQGCAFFIYLSAAPSNVGSLAILLARLGGLAIRKAAHTFRPTSLRPHP